MFKKKTMTNKQEEFEEIEDFEVIEDYKDDNLENVEEHTSKPEEKKKKAFTIFGGKKKQKELTGLEQAAKENMDVFESIPLEFNNSKGKNKNDDYVKLETDAFSDDFVILDNKESKWKIFKTSFKAFFATLFLILLTVAIYFCMTYRIYPGSAYIKGADYHFDYFTIVSRNHQPNLDDIKEGDLLVYSEEQNSASDYSPVIVSYKIGEFRNRNGAVIWIKDNKVDKKSIDSVNVKYVIKGQNN